jgi:hypothetical protein
MWRIVVHYEYSRYNNTAKENFGRRSMKILRRWVLIGFFLAVSSFLYEKQLGAIPFLLLSIFPGRFFLRKKKLQKRSEGNESDHLGIFL